MNKMVGKINNKLGVSLMISYVLLVVIAISMAGLLYIWLQTYIPEEQLECPEGVSLVVRDFSCGQGLNNEDLGYFTIELQNKGFYDIDGFYIRFSQDKDKEPSIYPRADDEDMEFIPGTIRFDGNGLEPGRAKPLVFDYYVLFRGDNGNIGDRCEGESYASYIGNEADDCADKAIVIKIQPYVQDEEMEEQIAICNNAIITQEINCDLTSP